MNDRIAGRVTGITCYREKGKNGIMLKKAELLQNFGMAGDFHAGDGERQISLLSHEAREYIRSQTEQGLCFTRFRENLTYDDIPPELLKAGEKLKIGEAIIEISADNKRCYPECPLFSQMKNCRLALHGMFAKVIQSGYIRVGDTIEIEVG